MPQKYINIQYPFVNSTKGFFLELTDNDNQAIKSDLKRLLFEPNDEITQSDIKGELSNMLKKYFPNVTVKKIEVSTAGNVSPLFNQDLKGNRTSTKPPSKDNVAKIRITLDIKEGAFSSTEIIDLQF